MYTVIAILIVFASVFLTLVVLVQNSKGCGLAANFASGNQTFGVRQTADFLEKATWTLAIAMVILSIVSAGFVEKTSTTNELIELNTPVQNATELPAAETTEQVEIPAPTAEETAE